MAKRMTKSSINWINLEKRVPPDQKAKFFAFKGKSDAYLRRMLSNPAEAPPINWDEYRKTVPVPGLVDKFMSEYSSLKVPYPEDKLSASVDQQWAALQPEIKAFSDQMRTQIEASKKEIARILALPKYEDMTLEMVYDSFPEIALDSVKKPTFWPHSPDEQLGYVDPSQRQPHS